MPFVALTERLLCRYCFILCSDVYATFHQINDGHSGASGRKDGYLRNGSRFVISNSCGDTRATSADSPECRPRG